MPTYLYPFSGGQYSASAFQQDHKLRFAGTWAAAEDWTVSFTSTALGSVTLGKGNIAEQAFTNCYKLKDRVYIGFSSNFAFSAIGDPTGWEEQNAGSGVIEYLSQYGNQDTVLAFSNILGRLVVFGRLSTQLWVVDANPTNFALEQTFDNSGTNAPLSVQSIGEFDVLYLDDAGVRSIRTKELTNNAYVSGVGVPIDATIRAAMLNYDTTKACAIVEPTTKQYWLYLNGNIYVFSNFPDSEVSAWSTFKPTYLSQIVSNDAPNYTIAGIATYTAPLTIGTFLWIKAGSATSLNYDTGSSLTESGQFTRNSIVTMSESGTASAPILSSLYQVMTLNPIKFVIFNGQVYLRDSNGKIFRYGGSTNSTYDNSRKVVELPWLDFKDPSTTKHLTGLDLAFSGKWVIETSTDPTQTAYRTDINRGSDTSPSMVSDSTFDKGRFSSRGTGTHVKLKATSYTASNVKLSKISVVYTSANKK